MCQKDNPTGGTYVSNQRANGFRSHITGRSLQKRLPAMDVGSARGLRARRSLPLGLYGVQHHASLGTPT